MVDVRGIERVFGESGRTLVLPMDHDYDVAADTSAVPDAANHVLLAKLLGVNAVLAHEDILAGNSETLAGMGVIQQINAGLPNSAKRVMTRTAASAYANGADMFGVQFNLGSAEESQTFGDVEAQARECARLGLPMNMFAHVYLRRWEDGGFYRFEDIGPDEYGRLMLAGLTRVISAGARVVKVALREKGTFRQCVEYAHSRSIPIVMAGGGPVPLHRFLATALAAVHECEADGLVTGTNVWGRPMDNDNPPLDIAQYGEPPTDCEPIGPTDRYLLPDDEVTAMIALRAIVHKDARSVGDAFSRVYRAIAIPKAA